MRLAMLPLFCYQTSMNPLEIIHKYYDVERHVYRILIQHGEDVASLALEVAERHPELSLDKAFLYEACMLHDIGIYLTDAEGIDCRGTEPYIRHGYLGAELLRAEGLDRHAWVAERHTGSGLTMDEIRARGIDLPEGVYTPQTLEEQLICYADKFYSKTKLGKRKDIDKVRQSMLRYGEEALRRFDALHALFAQQEQEFGWL